MADTGLQLLQGLSPDQRDSISQSIGGVGGLGGLGSSSSSGGLRTTPFSEEQEDLMLRQQRDMMTEQDRLRTESQRLSPFLRAEDWVVITIDTQPLPVITPPLGPGSLQAQFNQLQGQPG